MLFLIVTLSASAILSSSFGFPFQDANPVCPPKNELKPCTCSSTKEVTTVCKDVEDATTMQDIFNRHRNWNMENIEITNCVLDYLPSSIVEYGSLKKFTIKYSSMSALFSEAPAGTPALDITLDDVRILRGLQWELFQNVSLKRLDTVFVDIRRIGEDFKKYMPREVRYLTLENAGTSSIKKQAFERLDNLYMLVVTGGHLKKLSRDWFPRPFNVTNLNFSRHKISSLPKDLLDDMPYLKLFAVFANQLTTIDADVFKKNGVEYALYRNPIECGCDIKWITTSGKRDKKVFSGNCNNPEGLKGKDLKELKEEDFNFCQ